MLPEEPKVSDSKFVLWSFELSADCCVLTIGCYHVCTWVAECIVLVRALISTHLGDDENRAFLFRILQAICTEGRSILRVCLISYFSKLNCISTLQVHERSAVTAILSGARWTEKREKWGYGRWDFFGIKLGWVPECRWCADLTLEKARKNKKSNERSAP